MLGPPPAVNECLIKIMSSSQGISDEWGMGMNGNTFLPIHPQADEWG